MHKHGYDEDPEALARAESVGYEPRDVDNSRIGRAAVVFALFVTLSIIAGVASMMVIYWGQRRGPLLYEATEEARRTLPPGPLLQTNFSAKQNIKDLRRSETEKLDGSGVDPQNGLGRIPIERAIDIIAERGLRTSGSGGPIAASVRGKP